jgi:hypothetical protein
MEKYNVTKRWEVDEKPYLAFVNVKKGVALPRAIKILRRVYFVESSQNFQDVEPLDEDTYQFSVFCNGVEFIYSIEEDEPFQELAEILRPSNCCHFNVSQN